MELTNKEEQYYRVDFETAKLLKDANFNEPTSGYFSEYGEIGHCMQIMNSSSGEDYSAPLTEIVLVWLKELGYWVDYDMDNDGSEAMGMYHCAFVYATQQLSINTFQNERQEKLAFIQACCKHIIETKKKP